MRKPWPTTVFFCQGGGKHSSHSNRHLQQCQCYMHQHTDKGISIPQIVAQSNYNFIWHAAYHIKEDRFQGNGVKILMCYKPLVQGLLIFYFTANRNAIAECHLIGSKSAILLPEPPLLIIMWYNLHANSPLSTICVVLNTATEPCKSNLLVVSKDLGYRTHQTFTRVLKLNQVVSCFPNRRDFN